MSRDAPFLPAMTDGLFAALDGALTETRPRLMTSEIAHVTSVGDGVAEIHGFTDLGADEIVRFESGVTGYAFSLDERRIGVVLLGDTSRVRAGDRVRRTRRRLEVPVGSDLLGRVVNPLGVPLDERGPIEAETYLPIERPAPPIMHRAPVSTPLQTGIMAVDAAVPVARGQRELILGDRQTGKTSIAVDAMLNQKDTDVISIYCAIGQRASAVARVVRALEQGDAMARSIVMMAGGDDAVGLEFAAPYAATSMAEHFMAQGRDVLIVYDDLTRHARAYRELSLLLRRPPGREAYPGDVFHIHSRLLERATQLKPAQGGGSLTALPVVETQAQNIAAYIPTNLISITDGQIYISGDLFEKGHLPAIDIGRSVSRVGGKAQLPAYRAVASDLRLAYAQFEELETFARFGTRLDAETRAKLTRGARVREVLKQKEHAPLPVDRQIAAILAATRGLLDPVPPERLPAVVAALQATVAEDLPELGAAIAGGADMDEGRIDRLVAALAKRLETLEGGRDGNG